MEQQQTIGIIGAGALGIMYGARMTQALGEEHVFFVADAVRAARYQSEGFFCNGAPCTLRVVTPAESMPPAEAKRNGLRQTPLEYAGPMQRTPVNRSALREL